MATQQEQFLDPYRAGLESIAGLAGTLLGEAERLRTRQLEAIRKALGEHAELTKSIASAATLNELFAAQARFANHQFEIGVGFWSRQFEAVAHWQREALRQAEEQASKVSPEIGRMLDTLPPGAGAMSSAIRSMVQAGYSALGASAQMSEQAARIAESQIATATAGIREAAERASRKIA
jgi:phasin family protein